MCDFNNKKVILNLKWEFVKEHYSVCSVICTILNSDNNFLKVSIDNEIQYINTDCIVSIVPQNE